LALVIITVTATATDLCGGEEVSADLVTWEISYNNDDVITNSTARGASASIITQAGTPGEVHTVRFTATDGCGNSSTATSTITFSDDQAPFPFCVSGVTTAIMESSGFVVVWAGDFDQGSFDNCSEITHSVVRSGEEPIRPGSEGFEDQTNIEFSCNDLSSLFEDVEDEAFSIGDKVKVNIDLAALAISGMQFTLELEGLELSEVNSSLEDEENLGYVINDKTTSLSYFNVEAGQQQSVVTIEMIATSVGILSESISLTSKVTENESYGIDDESLARLDFEFFNTLDVVELYQMNRIHLKLRR